MKYLVNINFIVYRTLLIFSLAPSGSTCEGCVYGLNRTKLHTYAKLNCLK